MLNAKEKLKTWLAKNDLERVLEGLKTLSDSHGATELEKYQIGFSARYHDLQDQKVKNLIGSEDYRLEQARIRTGIYEICQTLPDEWSSEPLESLLTSRVSNSLASKGHRFPWIKFSSGLLVIIGLLAIIIKLSISYQSKIVNPDKKGRSFSNSGLDSLPGVHSTPYPLAQEDDLAHPNSPLKKKTFTKVKAIRFKKTPFPHLVPQGFTLNPQATDEIQVTFTGSIRQSPNSNLFYYTGGKLRITINGKDCSQIQSLELSIPATPAFGNDRTWVEEKIEEKIEELTHQYQGIISQQIARCI